MINNFLALLVLSAVAINQVLSLPCNCGLGRGVNVCSQSTNDDSEDEKYPLVVRPQTLSKVDINAMMRPGTAAYEKIVAGESNIAPLKPIGDVCSCGNTIITPAYVPKPACAGCAGADSISTLEQAASVSLEHTLSGGSSVSSNYQQKVGGLVIDVPMCGLPVVQQSRPVYYGSQAPADAVSKALAYQQLQAKTYAVDHELQYGFKTLPREIVAQQEEKKRVFAEENLYRHNGDTLELGKIYHTPTVDETAIAELEDDEPEVEVIEPVKVRPITLGALGFIPMNNPKTRFTNVAPEPFVQTFETSPCGIDNVPSSCNDGYKAGQVIIKEQPVYQQGASGNIDPVYSYSASGSYSTSSRSHNAFQRRGSCL